MSDTPRWFKSPHSSVENSECVEVAITDSVSWFKSSHSSAEGDGCVEVALHDPDIVLVRDTQNRAAAVLTVPFREWSAFSGSSAVSP
ncbi:MULTISPECIES: DUF397 domain-containing protein [unclassified Nocardiopsis]|uniref:DUF397 domain-containing protein n=1 Tax=Nocardiopsis TaxID=2013 RepID=UPI00387AA758